MIMIKDEYMEISTPEIHKTSNHVQRSTTNPESQSSSMESMPDSKGAMIILKVFWKTGAK